MPKLFIVWDWCARREVFEACELSIDELSSITPPPMESSVGLVDIESNDRHGARAAKVI
jgi:hypothetical protein